MEFLCDEETGEKRSPALVRQDRSVVAMCLQVLFLIFFL